MNWTNPNKPIKGISYYDHVLSNTPLGKMIIEWKSWKDRPSYDVMLNDKWIGVEYDLENAKDLGELHLRNKLNELIKFLK